MPAVARDDFRHPHPGAQRHLRRRGMGVGKRCHPATRDHLHQRDAAKVPMAIFLHRQRSGVIRRLRATAMGANLLLPRGDRSLLHSVETPLRRTGARLHRLLHRTGGRCSHRMGATRPMGATHLRHHRMGARNYRRHHHASHLHRRPPVRRPLHHVHKRSRFQRTRRTPSPSQRSQEVVSAWLVSFRAVDLDAADAGLRHAVESAVVRFPGEAVGAYFGKGVVRSGAAAVCSDTDFT